MEEKEQRKQVGENIFAQIALNRLFLFRGLFIAQKEAVC